MPNGTLITQLPCVSSLVGCAILGISEILAARRGYAQGSISTLIWPTATGGFLSLVSLLAIWMLGRFRSVEIQASITPRLLSAGANDRSTRHVMGFGSLMRLIPPPLCPNAPNRLQYRTLQPFWKTSLRVLYVTRKAGKDPEQSPLPRRSGWAYGFAR